MTDNIAIDVQNLGKKYYIGDLRNDSGTLLENIVKSAMSPIRRTRKLLSGQSTGAAELDKEMWALQDVTFQVKQGEVLGVIGRNGAGKSTLLKILSQITAPTNGQAILKGQVGSLLEVGTGFHNELTGRENVYLNGSILGLTRQNITRQFDEIVEFAGVEQFIDTPVKHYSSGMKVRLAFAVAAHLDTEILLTDEVLAVGDYSFQKKSLGKMKGVTTSGRTVIFVSHQLDMVREICDRTMLLEDGRIKKIGDTDEVIDYYVRSFDNQSLSQNTGKFTCSIEPDRPYQLLGGRLLDKDGNTRSNFDVFAPITIELDYIIREANPGLVTSMILYQNGTPLFMSFDTDTQPELFEKRSTGQHKVQIDLPHPMFKEGDYMIDFVIGFARGGQSVLHRAKDALRFQVNSTPTHNFVSFTPDRAGKLVTQLKWQQVFAKSIEEENHNVSTT